MIATLIFIATIIAYRIVVSLNSNKGLDKSFEENEDLKRKM